MKLSSLKLLSIYLLCKISHTTSILNNSLLRDTFKVIIRPICPGRRRWPDPLWNCNRNSMQTLRKLPCLLQTQPTFPFLPNRGVSSNHICKIADNEICKQTNLDKAALHKRLQWIYRPQYIAFKVDLSSELLERTYVKDNRGMLTRGKRLQK